MSDTSLSEAAVEEYFNSRGANASTALAEERRPSDRADPTKTFSTRDGYSESEAEYFRTGDASAVQADEYANSPQARRDEEQQSWREYQALRDRLRETEHERNQYAAANAAKDERLRLFNDALKDDSEEQEQRAYQAQVEEAYHIARTNPAVDPAFSARVLREDFERDRAERQVERNRQAYQQAALNHEIVHPGYVREIYPAYQQSIRQSFAAANPSWNRQQVEMAALRDDDAVFQSAVAQGRDPHDIIHAQARRRGIYSTNERNQIAELDRQGREKRAREQEQARVDAAKRERAAFDREVVALGGLTYRDGYSHDPRRKAAFEKAKRLGGYFRGGL